MEKLLIFPYGGNGLEAADCIGNQYELIGFIDDDESKQDRTEQGFQVFSRSALNDYKDAKVLAVPGGPSSYMKRKEIIEGLNIPDERFAKVISPDASVSKTARIGRNVLLMPGVVVTSNALIGDHVCVLPNSVIHHDDKIGDYCLLGANVTIAGYTTLEENCYIGSGSQIINNVKVGRKSLIGMGSNVIGSVPPLSVLVGNPARIIRTVSENEL